MLFVFVYTPTCLQKKISRMITIHPGIFLGRHGGLIVSLSG